MKFYAIIFSAILAICSSAPAPAPKPGLIATAPIAYTSPISYSAPIISTYSAPISTYSYGSPLTYSYGYGYSPYAYL